MFAINNHYSEAHSAIPTTSVFTSVNDVPFLLPSDENSGDRAEFTRRECSYQYKKIDFHFLLKRTAIYLISIIYESNWYCVKKYFTSVLYHLNTNRMTFRVQCNQ